ncbi:GNAT family N-acetyltransferase [Pseudalkalibacillus salsuginis]|uniref:GNAT family N-acetyltransferase n=1 Tax=Pseudalkalibacillus salsuginis TaxID=2910972 RepID=UPI001F1921F0|nr:GNAT family N-acetyltransferase [Pseudalkalibacillus salsuginis]MCF6409880.1 GNAT family N-acetyltransferase [Pseudalkalibacillus salsuginis]
MIQVVPAELQDTEDLLQIDKSVIGNTSRKSTIEKAIREGRCLVARLDFPVGFLIYNTEFFDCSFISLIIVHPSERRKGNARSLIEYFETISPTKKIFSSTNESNGRMAKVFSSLGYVVSGYVENLDEGDPEIFYFKRTE